MICKPLKNILIVLLIRKMKVEKICGITILYKNKVINEVTLTYI